MAALTIRGVVVDSSDQPIADAQILVGQRGESSRRETRSAVDGTFAVNGCKPGKNLLSAAAESFAPATVEIEAASDSEPFRIVLQPGRQLRLRIVDRNGQPIPRASLIFDPPSRAGRVPALPESQARFNKSVGQNGEVIWSNAPAGDLYFSVFGKGCMELRDAKVGAEETAHTFRLSPALVVHGSVRDAETGEKIPRFRIVGGWPQNRTGEGDSNPRWSGLERHWLNFSGGEFRHTFSEALLGGVPNPGYVLKFEADGYASAVSRLIQPDEVDAQVDALLRKTSNTLITVLLPNGQPAADADVGLPSPGAGLELAPARFVRRNSEGGALLRADAQGQFKLPPDPTIERVFLVHEDGYAETTPSALEKEPLVSLAAWGRLEGKFYRNGKPVVDAELMPGFLNDGRDRSATRFSFRDYKVRTDAGGRYVFQKLPPGHFSLIHLIPSPQPDGRMAWTHGPLGTVEIRPGETTTNDIGVAVCGVTLRVRLSEEFARNPKLKVFVTLHTPAPEAADEIMADDKAFRAWSSAPERAALLGAVRHHILSQTADGPWICQDVPMGEYTLMARVSEYDPAAQPKFKLLGIARRMGIIISAEAVGRTVDLDELKIEPIRAK